MHKTASSRSSTLTLGKILGRVHLVPLISIYLLFTAAATATTFYISSIIQKDLKDTIALQLRKEALINEQIHAIHTRHLLIRDILLEDDAFTKDDYIQLHAEYARRVLTARKTLESLPLSEEEKSLIDTQWSDSQSGYTTHSSLIERSLDADRDTRIMLYKELVEKTQSEFLRRMNDMASLRNDLRDASNKVLVEAENKQLRNWFWLILSYTLALAGGAIIIIWFYLRQRDQKKALQWQATHDSLTGLGNRSAFKHQLQLALEDYHATNTQYSMLHLDMDRFKMINDSFGHVAGDELLRQIAGKILASLRASDLVARMGGDEFAVLLRACDLSHAQTIAKSICEAISNHEFKWNNRTVSLGVSIGLVQIGKQHETIANILRAADIARYTAKDLGGGRVHIFIKDDHISTSRLQELERVNQIKRALSDDNFILYQQKIIPLKGDDSEHREILLRMQDNGKNIITPGEFLPAAEQYHLMTDIDLWVLKKTCEYIASHENPPGCFFINLSGATLGSTETAKKFSSIIQAARIDPALLVFEITETSAISSLDMAASFIGDISKLGCRFALDDFGSGLSSFTYLKQMPVDFLKIDGDFIHQLGPGTLDHSFVQSVQTIAKTMGIATVAEWVEDRTVLDHLQVMGIDYAQGFYTGAPVPLNS